MKLEALWKAHVNRNHEKGRSPLNRGGDCFVRGTLVHTRQGLKPIEEMVVGDEVLSQPEATGAQAYRRVVKTVAFQEQEVRRLTFADGQDQRWTIIGTPNHPLWVEGTGWVRMEYLEENDLLQLHDGQHATVISVERLEDREDVFNFEVDGYHT